MTEGRARLRIGHRLVDANDLDRAWMDHGACVGLDPDMFFPERGASTREAKAVCADCPVEGLCLAWALANGERFGIWGGKSERERRRIRRARARDRAVAGAA